MTKETEKNIENLIKVVFYLLLSLYTIDLCDMFYEFMFNSLSLFIFFAYLSVNMIYFTSKLILSLWGDDEHP